MRRVAAPQPGRGEGINKHFGRDQTNVGAMAKTSPTTTRSAKVRGTERLAPDSNVPGRAHIRGTKMGGTGNACAASG